MNLDMSHRNPASLQNHTSMPMFLVSGGFRLGTYNFYNTVSPAAINAHRVKDLVIAQYKEQQIYEKAELGNKS